MPFALSAAFSGAIDASHAVIYVTSDELGNDRVLEPRAFQPRLVHRLALDEPARRARASRGGRASAGQAAGPPAERSCPTSREILPALSGKDLAPAAVAVATNAASSSGGTAARIAMAPASLPHRDTRTDTASPPRRRDGSIFEVSLTG